MQTKAVCLAILTGVFMSVGQILFKVGSANINHQNLFTLATSIASNAYLVIAIFLYAATIVLWIYVLNKIPLVLAYTFTAVAYIVVPVLSFVFLKEKYHLTTFLGSVTIFAGILLTVLSHA